MKKENKKKLLTILMCILIVGVCVLFAFVKADSGYDTDYDFDIGDSGDGDGIGILFYLLIELIEECPIVGIPLTIIIIVVAIKGYKKTKGRNAIPTKEVIATSIRKPFDMVDFRNVMGDINIDDFLLKAYNNFLDVQTAWTEFDYDKLRSLLTDELFNSYKMQLKTMKAKKQTNIMNNFKKNDIFIDRYENDNGKLTIVVVLNVSFIDYIVDADNKPVRGNQNFEVGHVYELTYVSTEEKKKYNKCPNCNAPLENEASNKCVYCGSTIVNKQYGWVLSKKESKIQY